LASVCRQDYASKINEKSERNALVGDREYITIDGMCVISMSMGRRQTKTIEGGPENVRSTGEAGRLDDAAVRRIDPNSILEGFSSDTIATNP
jgi:hypothetical protein